MALTASGFSLCLCDTISVYAVATLQQKRLRLSRRQLFHERKRWYAELGGHEGICVITTETSGSQHEIVLVSLNHCQGRRATLNRPLPSATYPSSFQLECF